MLNSKANIIARVVLIIVLIVPCIIYFYNILLYAVNIPFWDDYDAIFHFLINFNNTDIISKKITLLFSQHNEHRIFFVRATTLASYYLSGRVNLKELIFIGNISLVGIGYILIKSSNENLRKIFYFIPISYILFQLQLWDNSFWAMACLGNFYVILFSFFSLYLLHTNSKRNFIWSIFFASLSTYTSGNGMFTFVVGLFVLIVERKYYPYLLIWFLSASINLFFYFHNYIPPPQHPDIIGPFISRPDMAFSYFFVFIGSALFFIEKYGFVASIIGGYVFVLCFLYLIFSNKYKKNITIISHLFFLIITAAATSLTRSGFGIEQAFSSRYRINSVLILILLYIVLLNLIENKKIKMVYVSLSVLFSIYFNKIAYDQHIPAIQNHKSVLEAGMVCFNITKYPNLSHFDLPLARSIFYEAISKGYYRVESLCKESDFSGENISLPSESDSVRYSMNLFELPDLYIINDGWALLKNKASTTNKIFIVLQSDSINYVYKPEYHLRNDVTDFYKEQDYDNSGFTFVLPKSKIRKGIYKLGLYIINDNNSKALTFTHEIIKKYEPKLSVNISLPFLTNSIIYHIDTMEDNPSSLLIRGWCHIDTLGSDKSTNYLVMQSTKNTYVFETLVEKRPDVTKAYPSLPNLDNSGFVAHISKEGMELGDYQLGLLIVENKNNKNFTLIDKKISVP